MRTVAASPARRGARAAARRRGRARARWTATASPPSSRRRRDSAPGDRRRARRRRRRPADADREVVLDRVVRPQLEPAGARARGTTTTSFLPGRPSRCVADPAVAEPQVPHARRGRAGRASSRALKRAVAPRSASSADLAAVAAVARDEPRAGGVGRGLARDAAARRPRRARASRLGVRRQRARPRRAARRHGCARTRSSRRRRRRPRPRERWRPPSAPPPAVQTPGPAAASSRAAARPRARRSRRAQRHAQRLRAVAAQHQLGRAARARRRGAGAPRWISTRRATASAVPLAATRPSVPARRSAALVAPGGAGDRDVGVACAAARRRRALRRIGLAKPQRLSSGVSSLGSPDDAGSASTRRAGSPSRAEVVALRRALEHVAVEVDRRRR